MVQIRESWHTDQLSYHHTPMQGSELAHPKIYIIYELLGCVKGPVLLIQSCKISMTQGNNRMTRRQPSEDPVLMVSQKSEILSQTNQCLIAMNISKERCMDRGSILRDTL